MAAIRSFYENHVKGKMKADCTTADILPVVKRITKEGNGKGLSYCQLLRLQATGSSSDQVGAATVFISHAWKYIFYEFLLALEARFKGRAGMFLWIDNFSHNQHEDLTSDDWITKFEQHIVRINRTVMILFPWENPIPFTRYSALRVELLFMNINTAYMFICYFSGHGVFLKCFTIRRTECPSRSTWLRSSVGSSLIWHRGIPARPC